MNGSHYLNQYHTVRTTLSAGYQRHPRAFIFFFTSSTPLSHPQLFLWSTLLLPRPCFPVQFVPFFLEIARRSAVNISAPASVSIDLVRGLSSSVGRLVLSKPRATYFVYLVFVRDVLLIAFSSLNSDTLLASLPPSPANPLLPRPFFPVCVPGIAVPSLLRRQFQRPSAVSIDFVRGLSSFTGGSYLNPTRFRLPGARSRRPPHRLFTSSTPSLRPWICLWLTSHFFRDLSSSFSPAASPQAFWNHCVLVVLRRHNWRPQA